MMAQAVLYCVEPEQTIQRRILDLNVDVETRLGRAHRREISDDKNGIFILDEPIVSYTHAVLVFSNNQFYLVDKSTNGTFVNGEKIEKGRAEPLVTGDVVQLGKREIQEIRNLPVVIFYIHFYLGFNNQEFISKLENDYPFVINLYQKCPSFILNLEELYDSTLNRFEILQHLNKLGEVDLSKKSGIEPLVEELKEVNFNFYNLFKRNLKSAKDEYLFRKLDEASHFLLRIACCRNFPLRKWLIKQELKLIFLKWYYHNYYEKSQILSSEGFCYPKVNKNERKSLKKAIGFYNRDLDYFKVPFFDASTLLKNRSVVLSNGIAYATVDDMIAPIMTKIDENMDLTIKHIKKRLHHIWEDKRIVSIIKYVENNIHFDRYSFSQRDANVRPNDVDKLCDESFPLCMNILHKRLVKDSHLRNGGRFQYGLFLKGIGLSLSNAMFFWRHHFTKKIPLDRFMKDYSYHIKHIYGVVGKMADYPPQNCVDIQKAVSGPLDFHGCPFKILDRPKLKYVLQKNNVPPKDIVEVLRLSENGTAQLACSKYFDITHGATSTDAVRHPNLYYESSRKLRISYEISNGTEMKRNDMNFRCDKSLEW